MPLKHQVTTTGIKLKRTDWEDVDTHQLVGQSTGDLAYATSATDLSRLAAGANNTVLHVAGGLPVWSATLAGLTLTSPNINGVIGTTGLTIPAVIFSGDNTWNVAQTGVTLTAPVINGIITTTGLTMPAFTLGGALNANTQSITNINGATLVSTTGLMTVNTGWNGLGTGVINSATDAYFMVLGTNFISSQGVLRLHSGDHASGGIEFYSGANIIRAFLNAAGVMGWGATCTHTGIVLGGDLNANSQEITNSKTISKEIFIPFEGWTDGTVSVAASFNIIKLVDGVTDAAALSFKIPHDFISFDSIELVWTATAAAGNMYWKFLAYYGAEGQAYSTHSDLPALGVTAQGGANLFMVQESTNPLALAGVALGDYIGIRVERQGGHVNDTLGTDVFIYGILLKYQGKQVSPGI